MNVSSTGSTVAAPVSSELTASVTVPVGWLASLTVKVPAPSSSIVSCVGLTTRLADSSSVTVTSTSAVLPV